MLRVRSPFTQLITVSREACSQLLSGFSLGRLESYSFVDMHQPRPHGTDRRFSRLLGVWIPSSIHRQDYYFPLLEKSKSFGVNPALFRKSAAPLGGGYITSFVPVGSGDPVEKFSQTRPRIFCSPALQQSGGHSRIRPRTANDGIEQRRVPAEALSVS